MTIQEINGHARKLGLAYERALLPLSKEVGMPQTAISILLFFANNPDLATARDICELRGVKRCFQIMDGNIDKLLKLGNVSKEIV